MLTKEDQRTIALAKDVARPLMSRIDYLEKELRRVKSELQNTKSKVDQLRNRR